MMELPFLLHLAIIQHSRNNRVDGVENEERKSTEVNEKTLQGKIVNYIIEGYFNLVW